MADKVAINVDTLEVLWGCPECKKEVEGVSFHEISISGWPICSDCEEPMEYALEGKAELWED
jgi:hypothetical protein